MEAVTAVGAERVMPTQIQRPMSGRLVVVAAGKAAGAMMRVALDRLEGPFEGVAVMPTGHAPPGPPFPEGVELVFGGHPIPDAGSLYAAERALALAASLGPRDTLVALMSGGGSALLAAPAAGLTLEDKIDVTRRLLGSGAAISEINAVRQRLSRIKGGRLAQAAAPAAVMTMIVSDIPGDDPALVASGPTLPQKGAPLSAEAILERYRLPLSPAVKRALRDQSSLPPAEGASWTAGEVRLLARARDALDAAARAARAKGLEVTDLGDALEGEALELGRSHAALARTRGGPRLILSGGETTVTLRNPKGRGGRNLEYLLALAIALKGAPGVFAIACDTDGIDGAAAAAGGLIGPDTLARARTLDMDPIAQLQANDAFPLFEALGDLVITGPTRTNVNDFRAILIS